MLGGSLWQGRCTYGQAADALHMSAQIDVKKSVPQEHKPRSKKVFVGGLATNTTPGTPAPAAGCAWSHPHRTLSVHFCRSGPIAEAACDRLVRAGTQRICGGTSSSSELYRTRKSCRTT